MNTPPDKLSYEFSGFRLDTEKLRLAHRSRNLPLTHKAVEVLRVLIEQRGQVVEREVLMDAVWPDVAVEDSNLSVTVSILRKALGEYSTESFIETFPKRGYKFVGNVREIFEPAPALVVETQTVGKVIIDEEFRVANPNLKGLVSRFVKTAKGRVATATLVAVLVIGLGAWIYSSRFGSARSQQPPIQSIAVLPFKLIGDLGENNHQGLGLADILITRLSNIKELNVRPTSAVLPFVNTDQSTSEIGQKLLVDAVLEGSILQANDKVRVTARLVRVEDQSSIWAGQFEKPANDQIQLQDEIALQVVDALALVLNENAKNALSKRYTQNQDAYQLYLKGRYHWNKRNREGMVEAERLFRNAIEKDPSFALAYVGLADILVFDYQSADLYMAIDKALELDPNLGEAYATRAFLLSVHQWKWQEAEDCFKKSIELNPGYATTHHWYATLLEIEGRYEEAKAEMRRALEINPLSHNFLADLGQIYYFNREYDKAREYCDKALAIYPEFTSAHLYLSYIDFKKGNYESSIDERFKAELMGETLPNQPADLHRQQLATFEKVKDSYNKGGIKAYLEERLRREELENLPDTNPNRFVSDASIFAFLGEKEKALENLERAFNARAFLMPWVKADPLFDSLRSEPRFKSILQKMNLPPDV